MSFRFAERECLQELQFPAALPQQFAGSGRDSGGGLFQSSEPAKRVIAADGRRAVAGTWLGEDVARSRA